MGLAQKPAELLNNSLIDLKHQVKTIYGLSEEYGPTKDHLLFGTGQGSGGSPTFWAVIVDVLFNTMDSPGARMVLSSPRGTMVSKRTEGGYVDKNCLEVESQDDDVVGRITLAAQQHERVLHYKNIHGS